jgi:hypothetical protein
VKPATIDNQRDSSVLIGVKKLGGKAYSRMKIARITVRIICGPVFL